MFICSFFQLHFRVYLFLHDAFPCVNKQERCTYCGIISIMIEHLYYKKNGSKRIYMHMHRSLFSAGRFPRPCDGDARSAPRCTGGPHCFARTHTKAGAPPSRVHAKHQGQAPENQRSEMHYNYGSRRTALVSHDCGSLRLSVLLFILTFFLCFLPSEWSLNCVGPLSTMLQKPQWIP